MDAGTPSQDRELLSLVSDPRRWRILQLVEGPGMTVTDLVARLDVAQPAVSHHLARLRAAGLVRARAQGRTRRYVWADAPPGSAQAEVQNLLRRSYRSGLSRAGRRSGPIRRDVDVHLL